MVCYWETSGLFVGFSCQLKNGESVPEGSEDSGYYFSGLNSDLKHRFDKIFFYTEDVKFVPREAFEVFPNLRKVGFWEADVRVITHESLTEFLKFQKGLEGLVFYDCHISEIDPRVMEIFRQFKSVNLKNNDCFDGHLENSNVDIAQMNSQLQTCFRNYRMRQMEISIQKMEGKFEKFEKDIQVRFDDINEKLTKLIRNTEKS